MEIVTTERLILRRWREADREPFASMNADPLVMEFFPKCLSRTESDRLIEKIEAAFEEHGFGLCAVESRADQSFLGFIGLSVPNFQAHFTPCVEIGWRLVFPAWVHGTASKA